MNHKISTRTQFLVQLGYFSQDFFGVQEQPRLNTVLGALRKRVEKLDGFSPRALMVSARTDAKVTALCNFSTFWLKNPLLEEQVIETIENFNNDGLCGLKAKKTDFHTNARGCSLAKTYCYTIIDDCDPEILTNHCFAWRIAPKLDVKSMQKAADYFLGSHDFSSFRASGCTASNVVKTLTRLSVHKNEKKYVFITISGDAFLRKMVRNIVGFLVEVGSGLRKPEDIRNILNAKNRNEAGMTAPAHGLMLISVEFNEIACKTIV